MPRNKKQAGDDSSEGAPEWMVTFSDCMTLLLTFFVLLLSFAGFGDDTFEGIGSSLANALPSVGMSFTEEQDSMWEKEQIRKTDYVKHGSETPTLSPTEGANFMKTRRPLDFRNLKVFSISSDKFFFGKGNVITNEGKHVLDQLARFLLQMSTRVVISENGPADDSIDGLLRAWSVVEYLHKKEGIDRENFSITQSSTMTGDKSAERTLEITLLERDVYE